MTSARRPRANQTPRNFTTRHVRHIFTQGDQTKPKIFLSRNQFVKCKQFFNPIFIIALKAGISSSLHTIILRKQTQTKHFIDLILFCVYFPFTRIRYIKTITINTHIDCASNSKCSVGDILLATKQGAFESVFGTFSVISLAMDPSLCLQMTSNFPLWVHLMLFPFPIITEPLMGTRLYSPILLLVI